MYMGNRRVPEGRSGTAVGPMRASEHWAAGGDQVDGEPLTWVFMSLGLPPAGRQGHPSAASRERGRSPTDRVSNGALDTWTEA
ncbi:Hypothetical protein BJL86_0291 [Dietzia timorensis]|uniref:Uncharacterized protein n=1 Tax=Dietzia timorensis TaxID=499555 RepID=A0A173LI27_9ACTN|nr:Hypothetical protein BJL86_0291 [Dietzia timorensis]